MTTESKQDTRQVHRAGVSPLVVATVVGAAAVLSAVAAGYVVDGSAGALGALLGGGLALVVFLLIPLARAGLQVHLFAV